MDQQEIFYSALKCLAKALPVVGVQFLYRRDFYKDDKEQKGLVKEVQGLPGLSEHVDYLRKSVNRLFEEN